MGGCVMNRVLFICTGNFYRSRFAEAVFNHSAGKLNLRWSAFSRGLAIHWAEGYLSPFALDALRARRIDLAYTGKARTQLTVHDLESSAIQIALCREEHYPMMKDQFPAWAEKISYWTIPDVEFTPTEIALPEVERNVKSLLNKLK
jgi:protein-tyrosine phosphatase